jgi:hypothetical protein
MNWGIERYFKQYWQYWEEKYELKEQVAGEFGFRSCNPIVGEEKPV